MTCQILKLSFKKNELLKLAKKGRERENNLEEVEEQRRKAKEQNKEEK